MSRSGTSTPRPQTTPSAHEKDNPLEVDKAPLPVEEDVMQLARLGEIKAIQKLFNAGKCDATYKDDQGITPLHWAAICNHHALCHFLIQHGADVNARGGEVGGTPSHWAARKCNYYIVNLLLQHGADPLRTDDQGFNLLQNATMDGNVFQLLLLLYHEVPVDVPDSKGHTSLMWAAYNGFPACVEVLLEWGANLSATDDQGFTALHWSLVKGSFGCIQRLVEYGADRFAATMDGKTPSTVAREMNTMPQWRRALSDNCYNFDGSPRQFPLQRFIKDRKLFIWRVFFFWPFLILGVSFFIISGIPIYAGLPLTFIAAFALQYIPQQLFRWAPLNMKSIQYTPWLSGIFAGSLFWVVLQYIRKILPATFRIHPFLNLLFIILCGFCSWFFFLSMLEDPGYVPKTSSRTEQRAVVQDLLEQRKFDERHFCVHCMVRKPLRSKHCRTCQRCVAKHDHHCPWISNCVGTNNHRHFMLFIALMEVGIIIVDYLTVAYLNTEPAPAITTCNIISTSLCSQLNKDPFTVAPMLWICINLSWVSMLIFVQLIQISRAQTTYENMKPFESGFTDAGEVAASLVTAGTTNLEAAGLTSAGAGPDPTVRTQTQQAPVQPRKKEGWFETVKKLFGVDTFIATAMYGSRAEEIQARNRANPFSKGCITNCSDFFCDTEPVLSRRENGAAMLGGQRVNYSNMYEPPPRGGMTSRREGAVYEAVGTSEEV